MKFNSVTIGHCLTEYTVEDYDNLVKNYKKFGFAAPYKNPAMGIRPEILRTDDSPICFDGEIMYGINEDGSLTKLKMIVDSSD